MTSDYAVSGAEVQKSRSRLLATLSNKVFYSSSWGCLVSCHFEKMFLQSTAPSLALCLLLITEGNDLAVRSVSNSRLTRTAVESLSPLGHVG